MNNNQTSSIEEEAAATISGLTSYQSIEYNQPCNVILPKQPEKICIDLYDLNQIIKICNEAKEKKSWWGECTCGLATLFWGVEFGSWDAIFPSTFSRFQIIFIVLAVLFSAIYWFIRKEQIKDVSYFAERTKDITNRCISSYSNKGEE